MKRKNTHSVEARNMGKKIMNVRMPIELCERLTEHARKTGKPRTEIINAAALEYVERHST